ncbi:type II toxin-antitoxin system VapB family antitoxin [Limnochorda pilosa]|uniref:Antitoxin n=1 Tax=Limnochorda pilosa TaxID=1555112 RepID=A0A0K2SNA7_LIMPI|nr:type II toxin-antitoxin system VapB family antitoxin [Limnochorda pilosa]BAS28304.1 hypothetical protein LIP_2463 [Limnochorda pilosa]
MKRLTLTLDPHLIEEAVDLSGASSKRQAVEMALELFVRSLRQRQAIAHAGKIALDITAEEIWEQRDRR